MNRKWGDNPEPPLLPRWAMVLLCAGLALMFGLAVGEFIESTDESEDSVKQPKELV